jgi:HlyD family secretion protein
MKVLLRILLVIVILGLFAGTLGFLYDKSQKKPVIYKTTKPFVTDITKKTVATGSIIPRKEVDIKPQISGIVEKIYVEAGDNVKENDLVAKIKIVPDMVTLNNAESRLKRARINLKDCKREFDRRKKLYDARMIPESDFLKFELAYINAQEELESAENNLQLIKEGVTAKSGETTNTLIRSTIDGMILDVPVEVGNSVIETNNFNDGTTIATIADMGEMIFEGKVDESEVGKIKEGMDLILSIGAIEGETYNAKLEYIAPKGVEEEGAVQFEIRATVELKKAHFLRAGYSANADIVLERKERVLAINESLLQFEGDKAFVEEETAPQEYEKRYVELGLSDGINIEIKSGLSKDSKIKVPRMR